jgi:type II secretory pathway predicted ATPase ExeA
VNQNRIIGVIGPTGSGKTYTVGQYLAEQERFVVFDIMGDATYLRPADEILTTRAQLRSIMRNDPNFKVVYRARIERDEKDNAIMVPDLQFVVDCAYATGDMLLVIDEAHLLCDSRNIPPSLFLATATGRHRRLSILYVSHRFNSIHPMLRLNTHEFWFWRIIEPADLDGIRERCGEETEERVAAARKLERKGTEIIPGEMVRWTIENGLEGKANAEDEDSEEAADAAESDDDGAIDAGAKDRGAGVA